jgi:hypothetical protein
MRAVLLFLSVWWTLGVWWTLEIKVHHEGPPHLTGYTETLCDDLVDLVDLFPYPYTRIRARARAHTREWGSHKGPPRPPDTLNPFA